MDTRVLSGDGYPFNKRGGGGGRSTRPVANVVGCCFVPPSLHSSKITSDLISLNSHSLTSHTQSLTQTPLKLKTKKLPPPPTTVLRRNREDLTLTCRSTAATTSSIRAASSKQQRPHCGPPVAPSTCFTHFLVIDQPPLHSPDPATLNTPDAV
ncbi:hypothetical protein PIB30_022164 [Stylosanthes scabra]|uniref:Uncharacterized protein n=1 Tax=Stylosanthes scabra TaxID=79078 RepID=A0ABU6V791_9FABA|nr:hypothetical protein [Stylosanthes scabra]